MASPLNQLLAGQAARLVHENFTGVEEEWWWERRIGGGIDICQTFAPRRLARELSEETGKPLPEIEDLVVREFDLEDFEDITLTFEIPGGATDEEAARILRERSSSPKGIAAELYRRIEAALDGDSGA